MASLEVCTAAWPIVIVAFSSRYEAGSMAELDKGFGQVFARRTPFAVLTDIRPGIGMPEARERKALAEWAGRKDLMELQKEYCVGSATILRSSLARAGLQALYWMWTPPAPQYAARDVDDAWQYCTKQLDARGVALGRSPRDLRRLVDENLDRITAGSGPTRPDVR